MTRLLLRLLLLALLGVWSALPTGPARAMAFSALCCEPPASAQVMQDHSGHAGHHPSPRHETDRQTWHAQLCAAHCLPVDAARIDSPGALVTAQMTPIETRVTDVSLSSLDDAPSSPPPRG